jgi:rSAM/selenodomain-associated transferase 1
LNQENNLLIIFIKNPVEGLVKSRLATSIGDYPALLIYKELLAKAHDLAVSTPFAKAVYYSNFIDDNDIWENDLFEKFLQRDEGVGNRMKNAFADSFLDGFDKVVLTGSDIIGLSPEIIEQAFSDLDNSDVVLGPAKDGGYYLIGMNILHASLFQDIDWSTEKVLSQTLNKVHSLNLSHSLLPELSDLDRFDDFQFLSNVDRQKFEELIGKLEWIEIES